jgi:hypothetical protein
MVQDFRVGMVFFLNYLLKKLEQRLHITTKLSSRYVVAATTISVVRFSKLRKTQPSATVFYLHPFFKEHGVSAKRVMNSTFSAVGLRAANSIERI